MFSAIDNRNQQRVILLDALDEASKERFRQEARDGFLHCPVCNQPVLVRFGTERRFHFAHKHLSNCPSSHESAELLQARAVLYRWLKGKFEGVTLEKQLESPVLPRWIDCWVESPKGRKFAYWIIEKNVKPSDRQPLLDLAASKEISVNFVFLAQMMARNQSPMGVLNLTTTEREFMAHSQYDLIYAEDWHPRSVASLHYLDEKDERLLSFRAMRCTEPPQQFAGVELSSALADLKVSPLNGELVHPAEVEALPKRMKEIEEAKAALRRQQEEAAAKVKAEADAWTRVLKATGEQAIATSTFQPTRQFIDASKPEGVCIFCGERTRHWWRRDGATGKCQCWPCRKKGVFTEATVWF